MASEPRFALLGHLQTREVAEVLETSIEKMQRYLRRKGLREAQTPAVSEEERGGEHRT